MKKYVIVKDGLVFWGAITPKRIISAFTNEKSQAAKLTFKEALRVSKILDNSKILSIKDFEEYKLNGN
jgi:hypothetical protein